MDRNIGIKSMATLVGLACSGALVAQEFPVESPPPERTRPASCDEVKWNAEFERNHPNLVDACQEAVVVNGKTWARFEATFEEVEEDGEVRFQIRDRLRAEMGEVTIDPAPGQVAYINERRMEFDELSRGTRVNLYVPEGYYGFASLPGAPMSRVADIAAGDPGEASYAQAGSRGAMTDSDRVRRAEPVVAQLPDTAGPLPWLAVGGALSLFGGLGLAWRRRRPH